MKRIVIGARPAGRVCGRGLPCTHADAAPCTLRCRIRAHARGAQPRRDQRHDADRAACRLRRQGCRRRLYRNGRRVGLARPARGDPRCSRGRGLPRARTQGRRWRPREEGRRAGDPRAGIARRPAGTERRLARARGRRHLQGQEPDRGSRGARDRGGRLLRPRQAAEELRLSVGKHLRPAGVRRQELSRPSSSPRATD